MARICPYLKPLPPPPPAALWVCVCVCVCVWVCVNVSMCVCVSWGWLKKCSSAWCKGYCSKSCFGEAQTRCAVKPDLIPSVFPSLTLSLLLACFCLCLFCSLPLTSLYYYVPVSCLVSVSFYPLFLSFSLFCPKGWFWGAEITPPTQLLYYFSFFLFLAIRPLTK